MKNTIWILLFTSLAFCSKLFGQQYSSDFNSDKLEDRSDMNGYFMEASATYNIPVEILQGIAYVESRWVQRIPVAFGDTPASYGVMGLRDDDTFGHSLTKAAEIIDVDVDSLKTGARYNIIGAAAMLDYFKQQEKKTGNGFNSLENWKNVMERYCGIPQPKFAAIYSHDVYNIINEGYNSNGIIIRKVKIDPSVLIDPLLNSQDNPDNTKKDPLLIGYPGAIWTPAANGNYAVSNRPATYAVNKIIIHDTEGSFASAVSWFQNASSGVSAHYIVRSSDGYIVQMVDDKDVAYHAGNLAYNQTAIGIEVEGYISDPSYFSPAVYNSVKNICTWESNHWGIPPFRTSIIGHNQVPDPNDATLWGGAGHHTDPGGAWDWDTFIQQVNGLAPTYQALSINTATLNVRTGPGATNPLLTSVSQNQEYVSYYTDPASGWYLIFVPGGNSLHYDGWISNAYAIPDNCAPQIKVTGAWPSTLKIRSGPSTTYSIIDQVADNQIFVAYGSSAGWYNYYTPASTNAGSGWSSGSYLQLYDPCNIITDINPSQQTAAEFRLYPNPAIDKIIIDMPCIDGVSSIFVYDATGNLIMQQPLLQTNPETDISNLPKGLYFIKLTTTEGSVVRKFVKE